MENLKNVSMVKYFSDLIYLGWWIKGLMFYV